MKNIDALTVLMAARDRLRSRPQSGEYDMAIASDLSELIAGVYRMEFFDSHIEKIDKLHKCRFFDAVLLVCEELSAADDAERLRFISALSRYYKDGGHAICDALREDWGYMDEQYAIELAIARRRKESWEASVGESGWDCQNIFGTATALKGVVSCVVSNGMLVPAVRVELRGCQNEEQGAALVVGMARDIASFLNGRAGAPKWVCDMHRISERLLISPLGSTVEAVGPFEYKLGYQPEYAEERSDEDAANMRARLIDCLCGISARNLTNLTEIVDSNPQFADDLA